MTHELAHIVLNHTEAAQTDKPGNWAREYEADALATYVVCESSARRGMSWGLAFWACDLALTALDILDRAIGQLQFGSQPSWISNSHPDSYSRRTRLRDLITLGEMGGNWRSAMRYFLRSVAASIGFRAPSDLSLIRNPPIGDMESEFAARVPASGYAGASEACSMTDAILQKLWQFAGGFLDLERIKGKRPATMWRKRIAQCFVSPYDEGKSRTR